jgi:hypothetical protein
MSARIKTVIVTVIAMLPTGLWVPAAACVRRLWLGFRRA